VAFLSIGAGFVRGGHTDAHLSLGGGVEAFLAESAAIRIEYRFDRFFFDRTVTDHGLFFGVAGFSGNSTAPPPP
jgi:hypothetical protein